METWAEWCHGGRSGSGLHRLQWRAAFECRFGLQLRPRRLNLKRSIIMVAAVIVRLVRATFVRLVLLRCAILLIMPAAFTVIINMSRTLIIVVITIIVFILLLVPLRLSCS